MEWNWNERIDQLTKGHAIYSVWYLESYHGDVCEPGGDKILEQLASDAAASDNQHLDLPGPLGALDQRLGPLGLHNRLVGHL